MQFNQYYAVAVLHTVLTLLSDEIKAEGMEELSITKVHDAAKGEMLPEIENDQTAGDTSGVIILYTKSTAVLGDSKQPIDPHDHEVTEDINNVHDNHKHGAPKPDCAHDNSYCHFDKDYPMDQVIEIVNSYHEDVHHFYLGLNHYSLEDYLTHDNKSHEYRHKGNFVCESDVSYIRPGWAKNLKNEWVAVVNTDKYPQSIRIETCRYADKKCEYLPPCYKSTCIQRHAFVKLLCVDPFNPHHRPVIDVFQFPSACSCFVENFTYY